MRAEQQMRAQNQMRTTVTPRPMGGPLGSWTTAKGLLNEADWEALKTRVEAKKLRKASKKRRKRSRSSSSSSSSDESSASSKSSEKSFAQVATTVAQGNT